MNIRRMIASAAIRKLVYLVTALVFTAMLTLLSSVANAQAGMTQAQAFAACQAAVDGWIAQAPTTRRHAATGSCVIIPSNGTDRWFQRPEEHQFGTTWGTGGGTGGFFPWVSTCPAPQVFVVSGQAGSCQTPCSAQPPKTTTYTPPNGTVVCETIGTNVGPDGQRCAAVYFYNGDGTSTATFTGSTCPHVPEPCPVGFYKLPGRLDGRACVPQAIEECEPGVAPKPGVCTAPDQCPAGMTEDALGLCVNATNECPAGNIKAPSGQCLPGEGQCAAGEARKPDGTCGKDTNGDGTPDETDDADKQTFSGGDTCSSPPSCSGPAVLCGIARIQWRIDCNTRRNTNISGGSCGSMPVCSGEKCDAMEHAQLVQQWKASCLLEKLALPTGNSGPDTSTAEYMAARDSANKAQFDGIAGGSDGLEGVNESDIFGGGHTGSISETLLGGAGGGQCSAATWNLLGIAIDPGPGFWTLASWIGFLISALAYIWVGWRLM